MGSETMQEQCAQIADKHCAECLVKGLATIGLAHKATAIAIRALPPDPLIEIGKEIRKRLRIGRDSVTTRPFVSMQYGSTDSELVHWLSKWDATIGETGE